MTPTSDERRKVAARLREAAIDDGHIGKPYGEQGFQVTLRSIIGTSNPTRPTLYSRLADLIEPPEITEDTSDGYHTFGQLYYQRMVLFAVLVQEHKDRAWKTWKHEDGKPCFGGGWFLVTIDTPKGAYGYHFEEKYWNLFDCSELPKAKHWDGYTEKDAKRLFSLNGYKVSDDD